MKANRNEVYRTNLEEGTRNVSNCSASHFTAPQAFSRETLLQNVVWKLNSQSHFNEIERRECMRLHQIIGFLAGLDVVQGER